MIECHIGNCEYHVCRTFGEDEGQFCNLNECAKSNDEMIEMLQAQRKAHAYDIIAEDEKVVMPEFTAMCVFIFCFMLSVALLSWWLA